MRRPRGTRKVHPLRQSDSILRPVGVAGGLPTGCRTERGPKNVIFGRFAAFPPRPVPEKPVETATRGRGTSYGPHKPAYTERGL